jgi:hypothetical protein
MGSGIVALALRQHHIVDQILWYCVAPDAEDPLTTIVNLTSYPARDNNGQPRRLLAPAESAWLAGAARTGRAWLEPAVRYLCHTVYLRAYHIRRPILERIGHLVRTLVIHIDHRIESQKRPVIAFDQFTRVSTLIVVNHPYVSGARHFQTVMSDAMMSCPSIPNLTSLVLVAPEDTLMFHFIWVCKSPTTKDRRWLWRRSFRTFRDGGATP